VNYTYYNEPLYFILDSLTKASSGSALGSTPNSKSLAPRPKTAPPSPARMGEDSRASARLGPGGTVTRWEPAPSLPFSVLMKANTHFLLLSFPPNTWHSMCATWCSDNGLAQLWMDSKPTIKPTSGTPITVLGQQTDSYVASLSTDWSFICMISRVHMWDYILSANQLKHYLNDKHLAPGNVFDWRSLEYELTGQVLVDEEPPNIQMAV
uniref:Pentraxin (PTX) domain-containing protein n=1 Tax=Seriola lalandi dorsalis TaxID=1841481 RepID=A0A3B4XVC8_SERLL